MIRARSVFVACVLATATGCATTGATKPRGYTAQLATEGVAVQAPMVAHPIARTLVVVIDPHKLPDHFDVGHTPHSVAGFEQFVGDSLEKTLGPYFQAVEIVHPGGVPPKGPYVVADVKISGVDAHNLVVGYLTYAILHMNWAVAFRPGEADDYLFSFAGEAESDQSYRTLDDGCRQTMRSALMQLLKGWTDKGVYNTLRTLPPPSPKAPATGGAHPAI